MTILKAIIYCRVSTDRQAEEGTSLETQQQICLQKAADIGAQIVDVIRDEGVSRASYASRPGMQKALATIETGKANTLIVANLSRYSRDAEHQQIIKRRVEQAGGRLVFRDMDFADTPEGDLAFGIMGTFADYERKVIRARTMRGHKQRAEEGLQPCRSRRPFGYDIVTKKDVLVGRYPLGLAGTYQIRADEAPYVQQVFHRYAKGASLHGLATWMTAQNVPSTSGGAGWQTSTLRRILTNPLYKGKPAFGRTQRMKDEARRADGRSEYFLRKRPEHEWIIMDAPALVDAEIWELSQQRLATNQSKLGGRPARKYLLSGLILCPVCGSRMMYRRSGHGHNYQCPKSHKDALLQCYNALRYEALVVRALLAVVERPELVEHAIRAYTDQPGQGHTDTKESVSAELSKLAIQEKATVRAQIAGVQAGADPTLYDTVFAEINLKRDAL